MSTKRVGVSTMKTCREGVVWQALENRVCCVGKNNVSKCQKKTKMRQNVSLLSTEKWQKTAFLPK